ncbi:MAG: hypothetical protein WAZ98_03765 [Cyclobacteriaceae bacterium]
MTDSEKETIKKFLTISALIDNCLLSGLQEINTQATDPIRLVSINNIPLENNGKGLCTISFIKGQMDRKKQLFEQLERMVQ